MPIMALYWMHMNGFFAVTLVCHFVPFYQFQTQKSKLGAATAKFGDPIGRTTSRIPKSMSQATIDMTSMHLQLKKLGKSICRYGEAYGYEEEYNRRRTLERNSVWFNKLSVLEFMKIVKGVRMANLVGRDVYVVFKDFCNSLKLTLTGINREWRIRRVCHSANFRMRFFKDTIGGTCISKMGCGSRLGEQIS